tara:strand:+ start:914 stop:1693 length:780 start_codon:yes stop_codon:yes gene_type:complete
MYFDEDLITDIRFNVLNDHVDKFVIVEATRDHAGNPKKLNFDVNKFKKFKDKIIYEVVEDIPEKVEKYKKGWSPNFFRENFHRNAISRALKNCLPNDLILISDADEIPNFDMLNKIKLKNFALFRQKNFLYKLNLMSDDNWLGTGICYKKYLQSPQWLRNKRFLRRGFIRRIFFKTQIIENGGWHFTFLKKPEDIVKKMKSYGHGDLEKLGDIENIKKSIEQNKFFIDNKINLTKVEINKNLPKFIIDNQDYFKEWIDY